jgi:hypothetical protein
LIAHTLPENWQEIHVTWWKFRAGLVMKQGVHTITERRCWASDLAQSMGYLHDLRNAKVREVCEGAIRQIVAAGR